MARGFLIALEGIDGAGKSTQARLLAQALRERGFHVLLTREPSDSPQGRALRRYLAGRKRSLSPVQELALFVADRRAHLRRAVAPALAAGQVVVSDRSYYSSAAYQGALGLSVKDILAAHEIFAPRPDLVFILVLPVALGLQRRRQDQGSPLQVSETKEYLEQVSAIYDTFEGSHLQRLDAREPVAMLHGKILDLTLHALKTAGLQPAGAAEEGVAP